MITLKPLPPPSQPLVNQDRTPTEAFSTPMKQIEQLARAVNGNNPGGISLTNAANDGAAAAAGVPVGAFYRNGSAVMIRVA